MFAYVLLFLSFPLKLFILLICIFFFSLSLLSLLFWFNCCVLIIFCIVKAVCNKNGFIFVICIIIVGLICGWIFCILFNGKRIGGNRCGYNIGGFWFWFCVGVDIIFCFIEIFFWWSSFVCGCEIFLLLSGIIILLLLVFVLIFILELLVIFSFEIFFLLLFHIFFWLLSLLKKIFVSLKL